jgi:putative copper resistance protein D
VRRITILGLPLLLACQEPAPAFEASRTLGGVEISQEALNRGHRVYGNFCSSCHGPDGSGHGPSARSLASPPRDFREAIFRHKTTTGDRLPTDEDLLRTIREGKADSGMPGFPHLLEEDQRAVAHYIKTFSPRWADPGAAG